MLSVLERIRPTDSEKRRLLEASQVLIKTIEERARQVDGRIYAKLLGSTSRDTWLRTEKDMDIFVFFPPGYTKRALEKTVTDLGRDILENTEKRYAEHPYIKGRYMDFEVEIVPCYKVDSAQNIMSSVDRTPFHDAFVKKHVMDREDDVRLLKQFLKGIGIYGAEARVQGFSGYLCELLVITYGTFQGVLEAASGWRPGHVITFKKDLNSGEMRRKFQTPLIVIDPVDDNRNVASALSLGNFSRFVYACKSYLKGPGEEFFFPKEPEVNREELLKLEGERGTDLLGIIFQVPDVVDDILYPQLRKGLGVLRDLVSFHGFEVIGRDFVVAGRVLFLLEFQRMELPGGMLHRGPEVNTEHEPRFLQKYRGNPRSLTEPFIKNGRWYVFLRRKFTRADALLEKFLSKKRLDRRGLPKYVARSIEREGFQLKTGEALFEEEFLPGLKDYLDPRFPWEN
jgi:tRNA nucleotidyltransferase (CCA-adding enzyme)